MRPAGVSFASAADVAVEELTWAVTSDEVEAAGIGVVSALLGATKFNAAVGWGFPMLIPPTGALLPAPISTLGGGADDGGNDNPENIGELVGLAPTSNLAAEGCGAKLPADGGFCRAGAAAELDAAGGGPP